MSLPPYAVDFRGHPACPCLAAWLPVYEAELQRRGILVGPLHIYQLIGTYSGSGGTHAAGGAFDLLDLPGEEDLWVARQMGAPATWTRPAGWDGPGSIRHNHGVLADCPHNDPASYQIAAVLDGFNGLGAGGRSAADDGPRPIPNRTWRQGIAWAHQQQEEHEMTPEQSKALTEISTTVTRIERKVDGLRARGLTQTQRVIRRLDELKDGASAEDIRRLRADAGELEAVFSDED